MSCPACGAAVPDGARFCPSCGQNVAIRGDERRVVTVLFADIVGFTTLSETRDPEQVKNLIDRCFQRLVTDVTEFGGRVDKIVGDAIVALFGAPVAHEDDAERAVRAALAMQKTIKDMEALAGVPDLSLRVGVNTGEVLVGALRAGGDYTAMGDVVNVASRLETAATPGQVVVGPDTHAATADVLRYEALGQLTARGREEPVEAWVALEALAPPGYRPLRQRVRLVGRDPELGILRHTLTTTTSRNRAGLVLLLGDAGVGKSRLAEELADLARCQHEATVLEARCVPYGEANVWWPLAEAVRQAVGISVGEAAEAVRERLLGVVHAVCHIQAGSADEKRTIDALAYLLGEPDALVDVEPARARDEARRALQYLFEGLARQTPVVLVLSELHWASEQVLDVISRTLDGLRSTPFLLVATARPELEDRWHPPASRHNAVVLTVDPLADADAAELLRTLIGDTTPELESALIERSGGNPFFLEELAALITDGGPDVGELPATLRGIVAARLDALSPAERAVLEDAAVVGRRGTLSELAALADARGASDWAALVESLVGQEMLTVEGGELNFRSDLVREVAYETLTKADRARRHSTLAACLGESGDDDLEHLAYHLSAAAFLVTEIGAVDGVPSDIDRLAVDALRRAAGHAMSRDMHLPAIHFLDDALEIAGDSGPEARRIRLSRAAARAALHDLDHAEEAGDERAVARATTVLGEILQKRGSCDAAITTLERAADMWRALGDRRGEADALRQQGLASLWNGEPGPADAPIRKALEISREIGDRRGEAWALQNLAWIAFDEGDTALADERLQKSMAAFADVNDWGGFSWAAGLLGWVRFFQGRLDEAQELATRIVNEMADTGDHWGLGMMTLLSASVRLWQGATEEALHEAEAARRQFAEISDPTGEARCLVMLIRALVALGRVADAKVSFQDLKAVAQSITGNFRQMARVSGASLAVQLGDPSLARLIGVEPPEDPEGVHDSETLAQFGMLALEEGDATTAVHLLQLADAAVPDGRRRAFAASSLALALAAVGRPQEAMAAAGSVTQLDATYLDRAVALVAQGLAYAQQNDADGSALALDEAVDVVDATGDELSKAVMRLARARGLEAVGSPAAIGALEEAQGRLQWIGVEAAGWDIAFMLAASGGRTPLSPATATP